MVSLKCLLLILWFLGGISMCIGIHDTRISSCDYNNIHPPAAVTLLTREQSFVVPGATHNLSTDPGDHHVTWEIPETYLLNLPKVPEDFVGFNLFPGFKYCVTHSIEKQLLPVKWCRSGENFWLNIHFSRIHLSEVELKHSLPLRFLKYNILTYPLIISYMHSTYFHSILGFGQELKFLVTFIDVLTHSEYTSKNGHNMFKDFNRA